VGEIRQGTSAEIGEETRMREGEEARGGQKTSEEKRQEASVRTEQEVNNGGQDRKPAGETGKGAGRSRTES
jgi:hypothetical protein